LLAEILYNQNHKYRGKPQKVRHFMNEDNYTDKMLEDGSTLFYLKNRFQNKRTKEQLDWLHACIRDSKLIVPLIPVSHKPDMLESDDGTRYLPMFSMMNQMQEDYKDEFDLEIMTFQQCVDLAKNTKGIDAMVIDGFTEPMIIDFTLAEVIMKTPSRLHKEEK